MATSLSCSMLAVDSVRAMVDNPFFHSQKTWCTRKTFTVCTIHDFQSLDIHWKYKYLEFSRTDWKSKSIKKLTLVFQLRQTRFKRYS